MADTNSSPSSSAAAAAPVPPQPTPPPAGTTLPVCPAPAALACLAAVASADITPPVGIYNRMWGAAVHDLAEAVHRPVEATVLALRATPDAPALLYAVLDWCVIHDTTVLDALRAPLLALVGGDTARVIVACTHTHGVGIMARDRFALPGGHLIPDHLAEVYDTLAETAAKALDRLEPATLTWAHGRCDLATNRDLRDPDPARDRYIVGYDPAAPPADDTLLVGRLTRDADDSPLATLVNYACHPTTLSWENRALSPDYIGSLRDLVKAGTGGAPLLFLQGASGELAPAHQYVGDTRVPDAHGRRLGYAVLGVLAGMLPPRQTLAYAGVVESGAPLAVWRPAPSTPGTTLSAERLTVEIPLKPMPSEAEIQAQLDATTDRAAGERLRRALGKVRQFGSGPTTTAEIWLWRLGDALLVAQPAEAYSCFQQTLRATLPARAVAVVGLANGWGGYLPPRDLYSTDIYSVWQTPYDAGSLEAITDAVLTAATAPDTSA